MKDLLFLGLGAAFFALATLLVAACERIVEDAPGADSPRSER